MKSLIKLFGISFALGAAMVSCDSEEDLIEEVIAEKKIDVAFTAGSADFSNYVAFGNSLTAGFMDAALYTEGQMSSFPNLIGQQLISAGLTTEFNQPDINAVNGYNTSLNSDPATATFGKFILNTAIPAPEPVMPGDVITAYSGEKSKLNNFGVPGIKLKDLLSPATAANPFYARFATNPGTSTILGDALATNPTFFSLWAGSNEVLGYTTSGGVGDDPLVVYDQDAFTADLSNVLGQLAGAGAKGVVLNIPPVTLVPFFRAIPYNPVPLSEAQATALNAGFAGFNAALDGIVANLGHDAADAAQRKVTYAAVPNNPILIIDEALEDLGPKFDILQGAGAISPEQRAALQPFVQARPATALDLIPLSSQASIGADLNPMAPGTLLNGVSVPFEDKLVLTLAEQGAAGLAAATYNGVLSAVVGATPGVELYDIQPLFANIAGLSSAQAQQLGLTSAAQAAADETQGLTFEGITLAPDFSPSGIFSTDGIHPNPRGHAIVANELIDLINEKFGSNIPKLNSTVYRTVLFK